MLWYRDVEWLSPDPTRRNLSLAEVTELAREVGGDSHHFGAIQLPHNLAMPEALTSANQPVDGEQLSLLMAAARKDVTVMCSASMFQAKLSQNLPPVRWRGAKRTGHRRSARDSVCPLDAGGDDRACGHGRAPMLMKTWPSPPSRRPRWTNSLACSPAKNPDRTSGRTPFATLIEIVCGCWDMVWFCGSDPSFTGLLRLCTFSVRRCVMYN